MRKLYYMGLEPYEGRYTLQLEEWSRICFERRNLDVVYVQGSTIDNTKSISVGQVLDAHGRGYYSMTQLANLIQILRSEDVNDQDVIFFEDMFQPGIESLPYIFDQIPKNKRPKIFVRCLAQSIDPDDFVNVWNMSRWMRPFELMVNEFVDGIMCTNEEMIAHAKIAGWKAPLYNISGLAFGKEEVRSRVNIPVDWNTRIKRVVFAARFDQEKQPLFFLDLIKTYSETFGYDTEFAILSGGKLRSNDPKSLEKLDSYKKVYNIKVYENLSKNQYYEILANSRVLFNCALQDWVSNTVSEADALETNVLYPAYRSFPETFCNDRERTYIPWSKEDAIDKLEILLKFKHRNIGQISDRNDKTIDRCVDIMLGLGEKYRRDGLDYRKHVTGI